jgi:hypothetical protein
LSGEGSRHGPVPCAWHPVSAVPSGAVNLFGATPQLDCRRTMCALAQPRCADGALCTAGAEV